MVLTKVTEWESDQFRLVKLGGLRRSNSFPRGADTRSRFVDVPHREINKIFVHHSAGPSRHGTKAAEGISNFCSAPRKYEDGKRVGGGRGWPGGPYTFVIPTTMEIVEGKFEIYRCWEDTWHTWHTSPEHNHDSVAICMAGWFASRHHFSANASLQPDPLAVDALYNLITYYLLPRYALGTGNVLGHFDAGKPMCPGDFLEQWVRQYRGEAWSSPLFRDPTSDLDNRVLRTAEQRQQALVDLGYDISPYGVDGKWGFVSRMALEAFQENARITADGYWGPQTEKAVRCALSRLQA